MLAVVLSHEGVASAMVALPGVCDAGDEYAVSSVDRDGIEQGELVVHFVRSEGAQYHQVVEYCAVGAEVFTFDG